MFHVVYYSPILVLGNRPASDEVGFVAFLELVFGIMDLVFLAYQISLVVLGMLHQAVHLDHHGFIHFVTDDNTPYDALFFIWTWLNFFDNFFGHKI